MVDSIDFNTFDLTAEFAEEDEISSQIELPQHRDHDINESQESTELETFDNYELNLFSQQPSQSPSLLSQHSSQSQSQHNQCTNCGAQNTLKSDNHSGYKICTNCSHIVQVKCLMNYNL